MQALATQWLLRAALWSWRYGVGRNGLKSEKRTLVDGDWNVMWMIGRTDLATTTKNIFLFLDYKKRKRKREVAALGAKIGAETD